MRTTVTLDDDVATKLAAEARRTGKPFKSVINDALRRGLLKAPKAELPAFTVASRSFGLLPGYSYDSIEDLLDRAEGETRR